MEFLEAIYESNLKQEKALTALSDKLDALDANVTKLGTDLTTTIADLKTAIVNDGGASSDVAAALTRLDGIASKVSAIDVSAVAGDPNTPAAPAAPTA